MKVGAAYGKGSITPSVIVILSGADRAVVVRLMKIKTKSDFNANSSYSARYFNFTLVGWIKYHFYFSPTFVFIWW